MKRSLTPLPFVSNYVGKYNLIVVHNHMSVI